MQRATERAAIAREIDAHEDVSRNINSIPEVQKARAKAQEAQRASEVASREFSRVFDSFSERGIEARLAKKYPGLILLGSDEDEFKWIARCAVTRLPIFEGDLVFISGEEEDYRRVYILADAVSLAPGQAAIPVIVDARGDAVKQAKLAKT